MNWIKRARRFNSCLSAIEAVDGGIERARFREGVLMPGSPRNFATEPATWYDFNVVQSVIGYDDVEFALELYWNYDGAPASNVAVFGGTAGGNAFYIYAYTDGPLSLISNLVASPYGWVTLRTAGNPLTRGPQKITAKVIGGQLIGYVNQEAPKTYDGTRRVGQTFTAQNSTFNGNIGGAKLVNLTTGKTVWSYPSYAERLRLITSTNVLNRGTHWEAANPAVAARIDTALDLRGTVSSYTVIVDFEAASFGGLATQKQELAGQGPSIASGGTYPICSLAYGANPGGVLQISQEIGGLRVPMTRNIPILSGRHVAAATVEVNQIANNTTLSVYLDGARVLTPGVYAGIPTGLATQQNFAINDNRSGAFTNYFGKIYAAALFNKALTAGQIAYLSN